MLAADSLGVEGPSAAPLVAAEDDPVLDELAGRARSAVFEGTPEQVAKTAGSYTGEVLRPLLSR